MKKRILYLSLMLTLTACTAKDNTPLIDSSISAVVETKLEYKIEKSVLSKGYQSIIPKVETLANERGRLFLVNLGVTECSIASIDSISRINNEVNIYTSVEKEMGKTDIVVPQFTLEIEDIKDSNYSDLKFNIVPMNYTPIELKFDRSQVLNKVYTQLNYTDNAMPSVSLVKENDEYIWNVSINNTFIKNNPSSPIYMLNVKVNSNSGELIEAKPIMVSTTIDKGKVLGLADDKLLAYVQKETVENSDTENIWIYDIYSQEKQKVYSTHNYVYSANFSPDLKKLAVIEHNGKVSDLYIVELESKLVQKITPMDYRKIWNIEWKDNNLFYGVNNDKDNKSSILLFDVTKNEPEELFSVRINVTSFDSSNGTFVFVENDAPKDTSNIYTKEDGKRIKKMDSGINGEFINNDKILYTKKYDKEEKFELYIYDLNEDKEKLIVDLDVRKFLVIDKENILLVSKNTTSSDFSIYLYNLNDHKPPTLLGQVLDRNVFYSSKTNTIFFNIVPPSESSTSDIIYGIDFSKLINGEKDS
ncbi:MAG: hypothetical protein WDA24_11720 [Tissierellales bacterium]